MAEQTVPSIEQKIVDLCGYTDQAIKQANAREEAHVKVASDCAKLIPACVEALVKHERILPDEAEKVAAALKNPVAAIQLLTKLASHRNTEEQQRLGTPVGPEKTASANNAGNSRQSEAMRAADVKLWTDLGLPAPSA